MTFIYELDNTVCEGTYIPAIPALGSMSSDPPPPYQKVTPNDEVALASQTVRLEQTVESNLESNAPQYSTTIKNNKLASTRYCFSSFISLVVFMMYLLVVIGCSANGLKSLYLVHFSNVGGRILVKDDTYAATAMPLKRDVTSAVAENSPSRREEEALSSELFASVTGISASGNWAATTASATSTESATKSSFRSVTAHWYTDYASTTPVSSARASARTSYHTVPEALYLPTPLGSYTSYMGYFGTVEDGHCRHSWAMGIPDDYYVSIWSYGYYSSGYKTKRNAINSGIDYSKMVNSNSRVWIYMPGLNYKETEVGFSGRSKLNQINNVAKALQPLSVILMVVLSLYVGMSLHILPRKWTPYLAPVSIVYSFVFNILFSVVAKNYATYITNAFSLQEVTVKKGSQSVTLIWVAFVFQCVSCSVELILYSSK